MRILLAWVQASRLPSQSYILFPLLLGHGIYAHESGSIQLGIVWLVIAFSFLIQFFIVYANDYADRDIDPLNKTYNIFSGGSRVLVEHKISVSALRIGIIAAMTANFVVCAILAILYNRPHVMALLLLSWFLLWIYSYHPLRLSYRGGGEIVQMIGVGVVLPLIGYYSQAGSFSNFPAGILLWMLPVQLGSAMTTTLPDEPSDRQSGKKTFSVLLGQVPVKWLIIINYLLCSIIFLLKPGLAFPFLFRVWITIAFALCCAALSFLVWNAPAGSRRCNAFVTTAVLAAVFFMASTSICLLYIQ